MRRSVAVIGGGVSGLTVAYELLSRAERVDGELEVICLEGSGRPGGNIRTTVESGFVCEWGPTGFLDNAPATLDLARRLGLGERLIRARAAARDRYIFRDGRLHLLPTGPWAFLTSGLLSFGGKLRLLGEPFARAPRSDGDDSIYDFGSRRIGREATEILIDSMVSGVYAGDVRRLSLAATFPKMHRMERDHGSLFRAMLSKRKQARATGEPSGGPAGPAGTLTSFRGGLEEMITALVAEVGPRLRLNHPVRAVSDMGRRGFRVHLREGAPMECDAVVLACPAWEAAGQVQEMDPEIAGAMAGVAPAPLIVAHFGYSQDALGDQPEGFGFLVPRGQGVRILGTLWTSCFFEGRAPDRRRLMTSMVGGAHDPGAIELDDRELIEIVRVDLRRSMGIVAEPYFVKLFRHPRGIPQYTLGHPERLRTIEQRLRSHPGMAVCGNSYRGISVNACIEEAPRIADELIDSLTKAAPIP